MTYQEASLPKIRKKHDRLRKALVEIASLELDQRRDVLHQQAEKMRRIARKALENEPAPDG